MTKLRIAREENAKLLAELQNVSAERDDLKTTVLITETSKDDELSAMKFKYQEEIASLKAIMHGEWTWGIVGVLPSTGEDILGVTRGYATKFSVLQKMNNLFVVCENSTEQ